MEGTPYRDRASAESPQVRGRRSAAEILQDRGGGIEEADSLQKVWTSRTLGKGMQNSNNPGTSSDAKARETLLAEAAEVPHEVDFVGAAEEALATSLVSSPGFGVVDSGCGKTLIGEQMLTAMEALLEGRSVTRTAQSNSFRFGNGQAKDSEVMANIPVPINGKTGLVQAAVIRGKAPLLLGRPTLEKLRMSINFANYTATLLDDPEPFKLNRNSAGQLLINLTEFPKAPRFESSAPCKPELAITETLSAEPEDSRRPPFKVRRKAQRSLVTQWRRGCKGQEVPTIPSRFAVAELFSPPRFRLEAERLGLRGLSFDKKQGWDLVEPQMQRQVDRMLDEARPDLLVVCPPCKRWAVGSTSTRPASVHWSERAWCEKLELRPVLRQRSAVSS